MDKFSSLKMKEEKTEKDSSKYKNDDFEVIVIDNVSTDQSHKKCKEKFEKIHLIENKQNYFIIHIKPEDLEKLRNDKLKELGL